MSKEDVHEPIKMEDFLQVRVVHIACKSMHDVCLCWAPNDVDTNARELLPPTYINVSCCMLRYLCGNKWCLQAVERINSSVSKNDIKRHEVWLKEFGSV